MKYNLEVQNKCKQQANLLLTKKESSWMQSFIKKNIFLIFWQYLRIFAMECITIVFLQK